MQNRNYENLKNELVSFLKFHLNKTGLACFTLGVSGGLDSAVVATLANFSQIKTHALIMPTKFSNPKNVDDAINLCKKLNFEYQIINIQPILDTFCNTLGENLTPLRLGNLSARIRMSLLYDNSARLNALVLGTSNKSELMLGYGTIYGDMACGVNPIGEIFKSDLFEFAKFLGVDDEIINKAPSADLWVNQSDEADLGYSYKTLDKVLKFIDKNGVNFKKLSQNFSDLELVKSVLNRVKKNKFKRELPKIARGVNARDFIL
ncbi:NAD+ synthase [Campylobacter gastrosuis]|uniref:NH(3)-dependent NAD(+) synthetase n=1 Tax=Campylobacter gastrosuis TaxID=2974576 RepID=A0ABT7HQI2_9BACT|nr:NAD+ synthase [Campylobacter gastrosuis]MDL0089175.1 NAD+ synthase [Campylobacter gastrosuis]